MKAESEAVRMFSLDRCHAVRQVSVYCGYSQNTILSLERYGSTGPTFQLRLIRIMVQLFGGNLEQEKRKRCSGNLNLSCPNFPFVCVSKWGSVPKLPTTNSTQMDRTVLLSALLQFHQTRYLTNLNRGQHVSAWVAIPRPCVAHNFSNRSTLISKLVNQKAHWRIEGERWSKRCNYA